MKILEIIDAMEMKEYLIFVAVFFGLVNFVAWIILMKRQKLGKSLKAMAEKLVKSENAFIDPFFLMAVGAFMAGIALWYAPVSSKKEPECRTTTIIQYVDPETLKQKPIKVKKTVKPPQIKPCNVN